MKSPELELKARMLASLGGDAAAHRALLDRLGRHLRGYYKRHLVRSGRGAEEAEDLVQEALLAIHRQPTGAEDAEQHQAGGV